MKLSIVIPAYNVEKYIHKCLDSVYNQDMPRDEFEVIVVNDGSIDDTLARLNERVEDNLKVISQDNAGSSVARNKGLEIASGDYIWFIDADDYIDKDCLNLLYVKAIDSNLDILFFELKMLDAEGSPLNNTCQQKSVAHNVPLQGREAIIFGYDPSSACACIYKRQFLTENNLSFLPGIYHQDVQFNYRAVSIAGKVMFTSLCPYFYSTNPHSVTRSIDSSKVIKNKLDDLIIAKSFREFANLFFKEDENLRQVIIQRSGDIEFGVVVQVFQYKKRGEDGLYKPLIKELRDRKILPIHSRKSLKHRLSSMLFNIYLK